MEGQPYILKPGEFFWEAPRDGYITPSAPKRRKGGMDMPKPTGEMVAVWGVVDKAFAELVASYTEGDQDPHLAARLRYSGLRGTV